ncbi:protein-disulfide reductase DsbD domain-containing protein [uncultured Lentibacter sp.]|uniref:protein-disulfide reductase DsbD domain-containing protein n=1 Tax=uncultured Lentibacter sp. TaxID=1659309 RepID=UPI002624737B|nr:protein-disulfide reductase DsbD domain-containing protein [uncultured Lentibacter sp.]
MTKALTLFLLLFALPLQANPYADKAQSRILAGWLQPDGTRMAALEITLAPGWHTYWRAPGDAGIPPSFDWQGSRNLAAVAPAWPRPEVYRQNGMRSIVYTERLVLPLALTPQTAGQPIALKGRVEIGVCKDICVPLHLMLEETLPPETTAAREAIVAALATVPRQTAQDVRCDTRIGRRGLLLTLTARLPGLGAPEDAAIETGDPLVWATDPELRRTGQTLTLTTELIHTLSGAFALNRSALRVTLIGANTAVDIQGCD